MQPISYGSVCSGIEAATTAWHTLGWSPRWFAEIEPFPSAVLAHHWPQVPNLGDFTAIRDKIAAGAVEAPDVLVGGTPCQAFSVAGLRQSLDDKRGQLTLEFVRLADAIDSARSFRGQRPVTVVWENVPGVLNTPDNAFGCFLAGLVGEDDPLEPPGGRWTNAGYVRGPRRAVAWRILDAQYFGVAQRRRRVFLVASAGGISPESVLFELDGVRRDSAPSREAGKGSSPDAARRAGERSHWDGGPHPSLNQSNNIGGVGMSNQEIFSQRGAYLAPHPVAPCLQSGGKSAGSATQQDAESGALVVQAFDVKGGLAEHGNPKMQDIAFPIKASDHKDPQLVTRVFGGNRTSGPIEVSPALNACGTASGRQDFESEAFVVGVRDVAPTITGNYGKQPDSSDTSAGPMLVSTLAIRGRGDGCNLEIRNDGTSNAILTPSGGRAGIGVGAVAIGWGPSGEEIAEKIGSEPVSDLERAHRRAHNMGSLAMDGKAGAIAFSSKDYGADAGEIAPTMRSMGHDGSHANGGGQLAVAFQPGNLMRQAGAAPSSEVFPTLKSDHGRGSSDQQPHVAHSMQVRRLTPTECERLQGFPDGHTLIPWRGKGADQCPDGPRYKSLGNSMAVPVMRWIGTRIDAAIKGGRA